MEPSHLQRTCAVLEYFDWGIERCLYRRLLIMSKSQSGGQGNVREISLDYIQGRLARRMCLKTIVGVISITVSCRRRCSPAYSNITKAFPGRDEHYKK